MSALADVLAHPVYARGADRPLRELTLDDVRDRARELHAAVGFGPTVRVAPVARGWRALADAMARAGAATVGELAPETLEPLACHLWLTL
jgi:hypothetical protein